MKSFQEYNLIRIRKIWVLLHFLLYCEDIEKPADDKINIFSSDFRSVYCLLLLLYRSNTNNK